MRIKFLFLLLFFSAMAHSSIGQVTKFKSTSYSYKFKNNYTSKWGEWTELERTEVLIAMDLTNERIRIFSKEEQVYDIIKYYDTQTDSDGDKTLQFYCVNQDGLKCYVRLVVLKSKHGQLQLYVDFFDMMWMYNIYKLD